MLQVGELIRELTVCEIIVMTASLYPTPRGVDEVLALTGLRELAARKTQVSTVRHARRRGRR